MALPATSFWRCASKLGAEPRYCSSYEDRCNFDDALFTCDHVAASEDFVVKNSRHDSTFAGELFYLDTERIRFLVPGFFTHALDFLAHLG